MPLETDNYDSTETGQERKQGWTPEQRKAIGARRRQWAAASKYGQPRPEMGKPFQGLMDARLKQGHFLAQVMGSWDTEWRNGQLYVKPKAKQTGRIEAFGSEFRPASEVLSPGLYAAILRTTGDTAPARARREFQEKYPEGDRGDFLAWRFAQRLPIDPATGLRRLPSGELRDEQGRLPSGGAGAGPLPPPLPGTDEDSEINDETSTLRRRLPVGLPPILAGSSALQDPYRRRRSLSSLLNFGG